MPRTVFSTLSSGMQLVKQQLSFGSQCVRSIHVAGGQCGLGLLQILADLRSDLLLLAAESVV